MVPQGSSSGKEETAAHSRRGRVVALRDSKFSLHRQPAGDPLERRSAPGGCRLAFKRNSPPPSRVACPWEKPKSGRLDFHARSRTSDRKRPSRPGECLVPRSASRRRGNPDPGKRQLDHFDSAGTIRQSAFFERKKNRAFHVREHRYSTLRIRHDASISNPRCSKFPVICC